MASDKVLKFLKDHNRPFTVNDIVQGVEGLGKSKVQTILGSLVEESKVLEKTYGKQKIYCVMQSTSVPPKIVNENMMALDRKINDFRLRLKEVEGSLQTNTAKLHNLESVITIEEAQNQKSIIDNEVKQMEQELEALSSTDVKTFSNEERNDITKNYESALKEFRKRKRLCMDMIEAIFENYPKPKKVLLQEVGIETDEDVNFKLNVLSI